MNAPEQFEVTQLAPGEQKIQETRDERIANASIFLIKLEDHTMGNAIRMFDELCIKTFHLTTTHLSYYILLIQAVTSISSSPFCCLPNASSSTE